VDELPEDQRGEDELSLSFTSERLVERLEILGSPEVTLELSSDRPLATVAVRLCDVSPNGSSTLVARGLLNLAHRVGSEDPLELEPGRREIVHVPLDAAAYAFRPGHRIRLAVSPTYWPWAWPSPEPVTLTIHTGGESRLQLPARPPREGDSAGVAFAKPPAADGSNGASSGTVTRDERTGRRTIALERSRGRRRAREDGLEVEGTQQDTFSIVDGDPLSATVECRRRMEMHREGWSARVETHSSMSADAEFFRLVNLVEAFENDERIYVRERSFQVPRDLT
jgi:hypothetical protein